MYKKKLGGSIRETAGDKKFQNSYLFSPVRKNNSNDALYLLPEYEDKIASNTILCGTYYTEHMNTTSFAADNSCLSN